MSIIQIWLFSRRNMNIIIFINLIWILFGEHITTTFHLVDERQSYNNDPNSYEFHCEWAKDCFFVNISRRPFDVHSKSYPKKWKIFKSLIAILFLWIYDILEVILGFNICLTIDTFEFFTNWFLFRCFRKF